MEKHDADRWVKSFTCWQQLAAMLSAQILAQSSLRDVAAAFNAHPRRHYHLGEKPLARSTLADANAGRPTAVFEALLNVMQARINWRVASDARVTPQACFQHAAVRLLDSTIVSLSDKMHRWAPFRSNNCGIKVSMVLDPDAQSPTFFEIAPARITDQTLAMKMPIEAGATYVFDRGYMDAAFWATLDAHGCRFVTRAKRNYLFDEIQRRIDPTPGIFADDLVRLDGERGRKYPGLLRRIVFFCEETQKEFVFLTNDMSSKATEIAALYKRRWQIELFVRWIKQNLELKRFLAKNQNAVRLQIVTALIAFAALKLLQQESRANVPLKRVRAVAKSNVFNLSAITELLDPAPPQPPDPLTEQLILAFPGQ